MEEALKGPGAAERKDGSTVESGEKAGTDEAVVVSKLREEIRRFDL